MVTRENGGEQVGCAAGPLTDSLPLNVQPVQVMVPSL